MIVAAAANIIYYMAFGVVLTVIVIVAVIAVPIVVGVDLYQVKSIE